MDEKVSDDLADMVNCIFRDGISDERYHDVIKSIKRPEKCSSLTRTRVNNLMWDLLSPHTRSFDVSFQQHQHTAIKSAANIVK